jgi:hypothetical protein
MAINRSYDRTNTHRLIRSRRLRGGFEITPDLVAATDDDDDDDDDDTEHD